MRLFRAGLTMLIAVTMILSLTPATAENLLTMDMLQGSSYIHDLPKLLDGDENTLWTSAKGGEQYLQIAVPEGDAYTLSLHWGRVPKRLRLMREQDGGWVEVFAHPYDEELPERLVLSPGGSNYRLVAQGTLSIAELSLEQGEDTTPTTTLVPVPTAEAAWSAEPQGPAEAATALPTEAPTPSPTSLPTETPVPSPTAAPVVPTEAPTPAAAPTITPAMPENASAETTPQPASTGMPFIARTDANTPTASPKPTEEPPSEPAVSYDASALVTYVKSKVGKGYLDACSGEQCSLALRAEKAQLYPDHAEGILGIAQQWDGFEVYDGPGLLTGFLNSMDAAQSEENWQSDLDSALAQWHLEPSPLASMPSTPGILLLHEKEDGGYDRIGVYTGGGKSVHARGYAYGVVEEQMPYVWTHWAMPDWLHPDLAEETDISFPEQYMEAGTKAMVDTRDGELAVLYAEPAGDDGLIGTGYGILNHTLVDVEEAPENAPDWRKVSYTDNTGVVTAGYVYTEDLRVPAQ